MIMDSPADNKSENAERLRLWNSVRFSRGMTFAGFRIERELGTGGTGKVFLVRVPGKKERCALKLILPELIPDRKAKESFLKAVQKFIGFRHPNFIAVSDAGCSGGFCYILMDYLPGKSLKAVLEEKIDLNLEQIVQWMTEAASAMDALWHEKGLIHGDIKPDNMLLDSSGHLHLTDAAMFRNLSGNEIMGTPQYIAPERLIGKPHDMRSDLYSLGITFYQLTVRKLPFTGRSTREVLEKQMQSVPPAPRLVNPDIPPEAEAVILKLMSKDPARRFQTPEELKQALQKIRFPRKNAETSRESTAFYILNAESEQAREVERMRTKHESGNRHRFFEIIIGIIILMALVVAGIFWIVFLPVQSDIDFEKRLAELRRSRPVPKVSHAEPPVVRKSPYTMQVERILEETAQHPTETTRILNSCDRFFRKFPSPETPEEEKSLEQLLDLFTPLDEMRCENARNALKQPSRDGKNKQ